MTSSEIRQSFLDFFKSKEHKIVPSSSLLPDSPNLLFTNAGMNQFVPIFLGQIPCPYPTHRAADTQKCIRAGGKHNDLEDVGMDTYHHTFFEMLGNWSYGDYFKKEAISWAWELITEVWKFPKERLYATVYCPDKSKGDPAAFDQEAYDAWEKLFVAAGLDPKVHIVNGNKKDNFWMMGDTGPCGPCSEIHMDLTPDGDTAGALVNKGSPLCIEIWNLVFMEFNANPDGTFSPLPAKNVDTGMGFERATSIIQCTKNFTDFTGVISNYETDVFAPIFREIEKLSGRKYGSTLPAAGTQGATEQEKTDVAFRVIADHIRTLSFAVADGIAPGNSDRNYVLRRILRRAVRYGRTLGFREPFFYKLVDVLAETMGDVFPEIRSRRDAVRDTIRVEEEAFNKTLDAGLTIFEEIIALKNAAKNLRARVVDAMRLSEEALKDGNAALAQIADHLVAVIAKSIVKFETPVNTDLARRIFTRSDTKALYTTAHALVAAPEDKDALANFRGTLANFLTVSAELAEVFNGEAAFLLYDTYGFPLDLTDLMARERGYSVDEKAFEALMTEQRERARAAQKKQIVTLSEIETKDATQFLGYETLSAEATILEIVDSKGKLAVVLDRTPCYAEMGGQVGDTGTLSARGRAWKIVNTQKSGNVFLHFVEGDEPPPVGAKATVVVDEKRRRAIERNHTATHLLHYALHSVVGKDVSQKGSFVSDEKLTFDFNSAALTPAQVAEVERTVNELVLADNVVSWTEIPHEQAKENANIMQFFGDKYGDVVRVIQVGGNARALDGYSMELCGGTHVRATGELGQFRIVAEGAIAAGVRRIEALTGMAAYAHGVAETQTLKKLSEKTKTPVADLQKKFETLAEEKSALEKQLAAVRQKELAQLANALAETAKDAGATRRVAAVVPAAGSPNDLREIASQLVKKLGENGVVVLGAAFGADKVSVVAACAPGAVKAGTAAGRLVSELCGRLGGKGGGKPDFAMGGGKDAAKLAEVFAAL
ncbi:alanine--tRNA ligase [Candidatus Spyradosoma sp. SGI.093]|uniref:alanine--tRNA ligase n=1 Tax=Candidatus Spyradosoma sp. SGI.093 TaxID=3420583 RepID=UPI003CFDCAE5